MSWQVGPSNATIAKHSGDDAVRLHVGPSNATHVSFEAMP